MIICEESGHVSMSYNTLLTALEANVGVKYIIPDVTAKSALTCTNYGKTNHSVETCHNGIREVLVVPTTIVKSMKPIIETKTQHVKSGKYMFVILV